jgi:hypothetical protein
MGAQQSCNPEQHATEERHKALQDQRHTAHMQELSSEQNQQHHVVMTTLHDVPSYLLAPHLQDLAAPDRLALLQSCKYLRGLAVSSAPRLQLSVSISKHGECAHPHAAAMAAWAATLHPALHLRLQHTCDGQVWKIVNGELEQFQEQG